MLRRFSNEHRGGFVWVLAICSLLLVPGAVRGQVSKPGGDAGLRADPGSGGERAASPFGLYRTTPRGSDARRSPGWRAHPRYRPYTATYPYYVAPWGWYVPQTRQYDHYPPPVALEPRLGLQHNYPYAWQFGLQMPVDGGEPLTTYPLGGYEPVVRSPQWPAWLHGASEGLASGLMKEGKYKEAGRILAKAFRRSDDPRVPLALSEAFVGLGKYEHADMVLRYALGLDGVWDVLPEAVAAHFPSADVFEEKVQAIDATRTPLLAAYMLLFTSDGSRGLDVLAKMIHGDEKDAVAEALYRHYLNKAFGKENDGSGAGS